MLTWQERARNSRWLLALVKRIWQRRKVTGLEAVPCRTARVRARAAAVDSEQQEIHAHRRIVARLSCRVPGRGGEDWFEAPRVGVWSTTAIAIAMEMAM